MSNGQLNIFSWHTELITKGWEYLAEFDFHNAENKFSEILFQDPGDEEASKAIETAVYWKTVFQELNNLPEKEKLGKLYPHFKNYAFTGSWGHTLLQKNLRNKIIEISRKADVFSIEKDITVASLLQKNGRTEEAETELITYMKKGGKNSLLFWQLAETQWMLDKSQEAKKNYLVALLLDPHVLSFENMKNNILAGIINTHGPEMAPPWAWMYNHFPLLTIPELEEIHQGKPGRAAQCCLLLLKLEKAKMENNTKELLSYRKQLKSVEPELFSTYLRKL